MTFAPENFTVWAEIPVRDLDAGIAFYEAATGGKLEKMEMGGEPVALFLTGKREQSVSANLFVGEPGDAARGPTVFLAVDGRIEDAGARVAESGGRVTSEVIRISPGRYLYVADPDGNRIGLFEPA
ncbi:MAG: VOC family protein [Rhodobacteraceae bacterium]|nr:VOC family protein [Paracoccaceae bacterium]